MFTQHSTHGLSGPGAVEGLLQNKSLQPVGPNMGEKYNEIYEINLEEKIGNGQDNIFFIESNDDLTLFHPRLLCAFESAAMHNPNKKVHHVQS